jgi:L,D-transpeptidase YcbB
MMQIRLLLTVLSLALALAAPAWSGSPDAAAPAQIRALLKSGSANPASADLQRFYARRGYAPAWSDPADVAALKGVLAGAAAQGLPAQPLPPASADGAARDVALTAAALAYATDLARGRVEPAQIESDWAIPAPAFDAAAGLAHALGHDLAGWYAGLAPHHPAYQQLVAALARYRALRAWAPIPRGAPLKEGMVDERVRALRLRLEAEGDLAAAAPPPPPPAAFSDAGPIERIVAISGVAPAAASTPDPETLFDGAVTEAVRRFQRRYGIAVDGVLGPKTLAALNVPLKARIEQIALNLERWRDLPHDLGDSYVLVNVPAQTLDVVADDVPVIAMKVVVGDVNHPTPVLRTRIVALTVNPTWTIPASIVTKEILPKAKTNPSFLTKNAILFVPGHGWEQLPGPKNPLGRLKFETPNQFDVYLHDTPSRFAFDRFFRAQSHGCVRLENAEELAAYVLEELRWNELQISEAMASHDTFKIEVRPRWRVWLFYETAFVGANGVMNFRDDLYGRDARLEDALEALGDAAAL